MNRWSGPPAADREPLAPTWVTLGMSSAAGGCSAYVPHTCSGQTHACTELVEVTSRSQRSFRGRTDYVPAVRPRQDPPLPPFSGPPRRAYTPGVQARPNQAIKRTWVRIMGNTTRQTILTPTAGKHVQVIRIWLVNDGTEAAERTLEFYYGTGATATTDPKKVIDIFSYRTPGTYTTRAYDRNSIDRSPTGTRGEVVSARFTAASNDHDCLIEYREPNSNRPSHLTGQP